MGWNEPVPNEPTSYALPLTEVKCDSLPLE